MPLYQFPSGCSLYISPSYRHNRCAQCFTEADFVYGLCPSCEDKAIGTVHSRLTFFSPPLISVQQRNIRGPPMERVIAVHFVQNCATCWGSPRLPSDNRLLLGRAMSPLVAQKCHLWFNLTGMWVLRKFAFLMPSFPRLVSLVTPSEEFAQQFLTVSKWLEVLCLGLGKVLSLDPRCCDLHLLVAGDTL